MYSGSQETAAALQSTRKDVRHLQKKISEISSLSNNNKDGALAELQALSASFQPNREESTLATPDTGSTDGVSLQSSESVYLQNDDRSRADCSIDEHGSVSTTRN